ncbi:L,D-transpeptidase/peptidoglycan binding protein [Lachnospiraceae bacterium OttesenSCG-928-D06]|nr:L,D-transpeptidase/peptidoglycan binding protein [Lachnospiraceae bacterium OttesenSCG-928-D06]
MKPKYICLIILFSFLIIFSGYLFLSLYYKEVFFTGTWINGIYCTGKTVEEVNAELLEDMEAPYLLVLDKNEKEYEIPLSLFDYKQDYTEELTEYLKTQNPFLWIKNMFQTSGENINPTAIYNQEQLRQYLKKLDFFVEEEKRSLDVQIQLTENGYELYNGMCERLNEKKVFDMVEKAIEKQNFYVNLKEEACYENLELSKKQLETVALFEKIDSFQDCKIVYDMGDTLIPIDKGVACTFIALSETGDFELSESGEPMLSLEGVEEFISNLAEEYNTYGKERTFLASRGDVVTISGGTYGTQIHVAEEISYLKEAFLEKKEEVHVPSYQKEGFVQGKDDIGQTYIEIDMTEQKMYYYEDGVCLLETDIVTGNTGRRMGTPEGINFVYSKQTNRILRGPGYASPVSYWMPVKGNIGIHDATWRREFGGEIYTTNGSHGCINTPIEKMKELYEMVEVGTPVIMFY